MFNADFPHDSPEALASNNKGIGFHLGDTGVQGLLPGRISETDEVWVSDSGNRSSQDFHTILYPVSMQMTAVCKGVIKIKYRNITCRNRTRVTYFGNSMGAILFLQNHITR